MLEATEEKKAVVVAFVATRVPTAVLPRVVEPVEYRFPTVTMPWVMERKVVDDVKSSEEVEILKTPSKFEMR